MILPKTHIKQIGSYTTIANNADVVSDKYIGKEITIRLYEAGIAHHHNQYTPTIVYYVSIDGETGVRFSGTGAQKRAEAEIKKTVRTITI